MKIALYGLPCAGKTSLMKELKNIKLIYGSEELNKLCNGHFSELPENEKKNVRIRYTEYVNNLKDDTIISDGHYSFLDNVVFTDEDRNLYDVFLYLYCNPQIILNRMKQSEKNAKYATLSNEVIRKWQNFELSSLRSECHKYGKDFYVIDDNELTSCKFQDFVVFLISGFSTYGHAEQLVKKIRDIYPNPCELYITDGDKTIIKQDSFRFCCKGKTQIFDGNFYTGYQSYLFEHELKESTVDDGTVDQIEVNGFITEKIKDKKAIILSSGIKELWEKIAVRKHLLNVFADPMISADTKYYVVKLLREAGYRIIAYGDSKIDLYMLQEADEGFLFIGDKLSRSLREEHIAGIKLIYNMEPYILANENCEDVQQDIAICKSASGINGGKLAAAHLRLGQQIGSKIAELIPKQDTAIIVLERGGRFFGDGLYSTFGSTFYSFNPKIDSIPNIDTPRIVIVDSVINTGKSIVKQIDLLRKSHPNTEIVIATNVIQRKALELFKNYKVYAVRISDNFYIGMKQANQIAGTGPDTADRLFNLIKSNF